MEIPPLEKQYVVPLGQLDCVNIVLVGVGGTGANLALILARLAFTAKQQGLAVRLTFVDPDIIEIGNVGRQPFYLASLGLNKAASLAYRLSLAYGLAITAVPHPFTHKLPRTNNLFSHSSYRRRAANLLLGCVDNHLARRELAACLERQQGTVWGIDCGNAYSSGQVLIGNLPANSRITLNPLGMCSGLPAPYVQEPALLEPDPVEAPQQSCAELARRGEQSLIINAQVAAVAGQMVHDFFFAREVRQMAAAFNLSPMVMQATPITQTTLTPYL